MTEKRVEVDQKKESVVEELKSPVKLEEVPAVLNPVTFFKNFNPGSRRT